MFHELLIAIASGVLAIPILLFLRRKLRARSAEQLGALLNQVPEELGHIENGFSPYASSNIYIPKRELQPLASSLEDIRKGRLVKLGKLAKRVGDEEQSSQAESLQKRALNLQEALDRHNPRYVKREIRENASLLLDEIGLDETQCLAVVRDDIANLVIGGAGSGKTRVLTGRVRYLTRRGVTPENILAVTFTNKARDEMRERLEKAGIPVEGEAARGVTISTLHALGKRIVESTRTEPISVADDNWGNTLVAGALRDARKGRDSELTRLYVNALANFYRSEDERAPELEADKTYRTLRGEHVRSVGERIVADFLLTHNVPYRYEARAAWATVGGGRDSYHPDFYLPGIDAHIEYWGVDREGNVAPWMSTSSEEYRDGIAWKRRQFLQSGKTLIECYDYERVEETLEARLEERLTTAGVELRSMTLQQLEEASKEMKYIGSIVESLLGAFLTNARSLRLSPEEVHQRLRGETPRVKHFGRLGAAILERYESNLRREGRIDFADMLYQAADAVEQGRSSLPRFEHILVDEFQDTSAAMAHFIKALVKQNESHIFAVGDDWQAIYGFAGGDIDYIVNFEDHFGPATITMVSTNYRSPSIVVNAGAALISKNKKQVPKDILIASQEQGEAWVHEVPDDDEALVAHTVQLVQEELGKHDPKDILVLSRTGHLLENLTEACRRANIPVSNPAREDGGIRILTAHKSKGLEGGVVIIINASDHLFGFPSKVENRDVLEPVRMGAGNDEAEERRLFYVALTRAMKRLHLVTRQGLPSPYIAEIEGRVKGRTAMAPDRVRVGARFSGTFTVDRLFPVSSRQSQARIRQVGEFATGDGRMRFTSWLPFNLESGATYSFTGILKDKPYGDMEKVKLDRSSRAKLISRAAADGPSHAYRPLSPSPPSAHRPRLLKRPT